MTDRITTTCQHSHTVTLRLEEGEWPGYLEVVWDGPDEEFYAYTTDGWWPKVDGNRVPPRVHREIKAALTAAEASCGGCGCAERLRAEAERYRGWMTEHSDALGQVAKRLKSEPSAYKEWLARRDLVLENQEAFHALARAADFLDAAQDARGSDLSAEQPATVAEHGDTKKRAEWNDPKSGGCGPKGQCVLTLPATETDFEWPDIDQEATDG